MPGASRPSFRLALTAPRHWPAWLGVGAMWLAAHLPGRLPWRLGRVLGALAVRIRNQRRRIAERNIALCFPGLDAAAQRHLLDAHMRDLGMMMMEFTMGWLGSDRAIARIPARIEGLGHLQAAQARGQGVLLVGGHFSHLELCARLVSARIPIAGMYRRMDSEVFEWVVLRARLHYAQAMFDKDDLRGTVKYLRDGGVLWYAPDQDMRSKDNVFVPFFDVPAATITATHHLARMGRAQVIPFFHHRLQDGSYVLRLEAPLDPFPTDDVTADTARVNQAIERMVREAPAQYLWVHKRFKTRSGGMPSVYGQGASVANRDPGSGIRDP
ncbi:LpxL/LpxP family Kdo(2)-lipid IV(A) lauroyl/palmitoleoyl acyltransferase [Dyella sp.]|uniref:LpxL/LpxP family Kdo(2)-lipid IV(A) lauroyl/palmitoleoyl acyltransferase n=1 Tax=Dyella sp. TaxID=1869338 RepID=UPI002D79A2A2|nr:LpxL/LpxP family Kdo(2)-lipid IV(A) lauroyl/palmitoleoyl acyltransferase [Dyella sp.]HET7330723.1 LpxL/LpxP family Kdo(2)-lipid IV(A) lauroyl/palmitoleoyl acyltransferase [Dyella sp.]